MAIFSLTRGIILVIIMIIVYLAFIGSSKKTREGYTGETPSCNNLQKNPTDPPWNIGANQNPKSGEGVYGSGWTQDHTGAYICPPTACYNEHGMSDNPTQKCMLPTLSGGDSDAQDPPSCDNLRQSDTDPLWTTGANQNPGSGEGVYGSGWISHNGAYICPPNACYNQYGMANNPTQKCMLPIKKSARALNNIDNASDAPSCDNLQADSSDPPWITGTNQSPGAGEGVYGSGWTQDHTGAYICPPTACYNEHGMANNPTQKCMLPVKHSGLDWVESKGQIMEGAGCNVTMATIEECSSGTGINGQMGPLNKCGWRGEKAAKAGCINWTECGGFTCVPNKSTGFCYAAPMGGNIVINKVKGLDTYDAFLKPPGDVPNVKAGICAGAISAALINTGGGDEQCNSSVPNQPTNCVWGEWSDWGPCTAKCGELATQKSTREIKIHAENGGIDCSGETVRTRSSGCDASNTKILADKPSDYLATCKKPKDDPNAIPPSRYLPPPPKVTSLLGGLRPKTAIGNPTTTAEDSYNKIIYWQAKRNNNLTKQTMSVSNEMKKQKEANKKNIINDSKYRDYTKPDLRMFPLLQSINQSLTKLTS